MYEENDLYHGMMLYWGKGIEENEIYTWNKYNSTVTSIGKNATQCKGYDTAQIIRELNAGSCKLHPPGECIDDIFN